MSENMFDPDVYYNELQKNVEQIQKITDLKPDVAIVLGSGLDHFVSQLEVEAEISFSELDNFPVSTNKAHKGKFILAKAKGTRLICMSGRIHYYEGYPMRDVVKPIRLMNMLGAKTIIITHSVGAINPFYKVGDFVSVRDHISMFVPSPLVGPNISQLGDDFTDMTNIYDDDINHVLYEIARDNHLKLNQGVMVQSSGRQYESPAETKMLHALGADIVGMSSTCEAIAARHAGMRITEIACITNMAGGLQDVVTDEEVKARAVAVNKGFSALVNGILEFLKDEYDLKLTYKRFKTAEAIIQMEEEENKQSPDN
ncbi:MAG: purine-nucleoside phosphorylase [Coriobacteriia bacterium]|nr:purine-nucleoside phosphorylase [Coriobacteriia bacterium]